MNKISGKVLVLGVVGVLVVAGLGYGGYRLWNEKKSSAQNQHPNSDAIPNESTVSAYLKNLSGPDICSIIKQKPLNVDTADKIAVIKTGQKNTKEYDNELWLMDVDGSNEKLIATMRASVQSLNWSPDRSKLAYLAHINKTNEFSMNESSKYELCVYDFTNDTATWTENKSDSSNTFPFNYYWTKDSGFLVYARGSDIWKYDLITKDNILITKEETFEKSDQASYIPVINIPIFISADKIYYTLNINDTYDQIVAVNISDSTKKNYDTQQKLLFLGVAPDDGYVVYTVNYRESQSDFGSKVILGNLMSNEEKEIARYGPCTEISAVGFAQDSSKFLLKNQCGDGIDAIIYSKDGSLVKSLLYLGIGVPTRVLLSPDDSSIFASFFNYTPQNKYALFDIAGNVIKEPFMLSDSGEKKISSVIDWSTNSVQYSN